MNETWLDITNLPAEGQEFTFTDQGLWTGPWRELGLPGDGPSGAGPIEADLRITPADDGWLVTGSLTGVVDMVCDRCAGPASLRLDHMVENFADRPGRAAKADDAGDREDIVRLTGSKAELDVGSLLWEELLLALPVKPLCRTDCAGLCPSCGVDRNETPCDCARDGGDPRMSVFRGLKLDDN